MKNIFLTSFFLFFCTSCSSVSYILEAGYGQLKIFNNARPLDSVIKMGKLSAHEEKVLSEMPHIREYSKKIGLKKNKNYQEYVSLDQDYVTYVVTASDPLAFKVRTWSFPVVGSFNYIGFHKEKSANNFALELKKENLDVSVRGARAYSTLGWFSDPLLSSMIIPKDFGVGYFANLIIHETVHVTVYIPNQSYFNESLADFFADQVTAGYLVQRFGKESKEYKSYNEYIDKGELFQNELHILYKKLGELYLKENISNEEKLNQKKIWIDEVQSKFKSSYEINNASLTQYKTYGVGRVEFDQLFKYTGENPVEFISCISQVKKNDFKEDHMQDFSGIIENLIKNSCYRHQQ